MLHEKLMVYRESIALAEDLCKEVATWPRGFGYLGDQTRRAMASDVLCIAEGNAKRSSLERRRFFETSRASIAEVAACVDLARVFGITPPERAASYKVRCERISRMLWGMMK